MDQSQERKLLLRLKRNTATTKNPPEVTLRGLAPAQVARRPRNDATYTANQLMTHADDPLVSAAPDLSCELTMLYTEKKPSILGRSNCVLFSAALENS